MPARTLATIDSQARDLLARLDGRYKKFRTFESVVDFRGTEEGVTQISMRFRVQLERFRGVVTVAEPKRGVQKRVFDGQNVLATDSNFPRRFTREILKAERYGLRVFLRQSGAKGIAVGLLTDDNLASIFLDPDLKSIAMGTTEAVDGKTLQSVIFQMEGENGKATLRLLIDPQTLILHRVVGTDNTPATDAKTFTFFEDYSEIRFDEVLPPNLFSTFAPSGFRVIENFETNVATATPPVANNFVK